MFTLTRFIVVAATISVSCWTHAERLSNQYLETVQKEFDVTDYSHSDELNLYSFDGIFHHVDDINNYSATKTQLKNWVKGDSMLFPYDRRFELTVCRYFREPVIAFKFCFAHLGQILNNASIAFSINASGDVFRTDVAPPVVDFDTIAQAFGTAMTDQKQVEALVKQDEQSVREQFLAGHNDFGSNIQLWDLKSLGTSADTINNARFLKVQLNLNQTTPHVTWSVDHLLGYIIDAEHRTIYRRVSLNDYD